MNHWMSLSFSKCKAQFFFNTLIKYWGWQLLVWLSGVVWLHIGRDLEEGSIGYREDISLVQEWRPGHIGHHRSDNIRNLIGKWVCVGSSGTGWLLNWSWPFSSSSATHVKSEYKCHSFNISWKLFSFLHIFCSWGLHSYCLTRVVSSNILVFIICWVLFKWTVFMRGLCFAFRLDFILFYYSRLNREKIVFCTTQISATPEGNFS